MDQKLIDEILLRIKGPTIVLEKIVRNVYLPKIFVKAALKELQILKKLLDKETAKRIS